MFYATAERDRTKLPRDPFKAIVAPRPIGWISTRALDGRVNLAPYSFFNGFSSLPPIVRSEVAARSVQGDRRPAPDWLDLDARPRRARQSRPLQLLQRLFELAADRPI